MVGSPEGKGLVHSTKNHTANHVFQQVPEAWGLGVVTQLPRVGSVHTGQTGLLWVGLSGGS